MQDLYLSLRVGEQQKFSKAPIFASLRPFFRLCFPPSVKFNSERVGPNMPTGELCTNLQVLIIS